MQTSDVYFDPHDVEIHRDPYPTYQRLRDEAPVYYNERHDFYAFSRYDDVERGLADRQTSYRDAASRSGMSTPARPGWRRVPPSAAGRTFHSSSPDVEHAISASHS
jgi:cytochrome P450